MKILNADAHAPSEHGRARKPRVRETQAMRLLHGLGFGAPDGTLSTAPLAWTSPERGRWMKLGCGPL